MDDPWPTTKLLCSLSEESYDRTFSAYRYWIRLGAARGGVSNLQIYKDILDNVRPNLITVPWLEKVHQDVNYYYSAPPDSIARGQLIHTDARLLLRFITDAEQDPVLSTYAIGLHDRLCRESLELFFRRTLDYISGSTAVQLREFYTWVNLIAHWVNLGYVKLEDVRDHILQSTVHACHLNSLMILLKVSGATLAAYVDPPIMDRCCDLIQSSNCSGGTILPELAKVRTPILGTTMNY